MPEDISFASFNLYNFQKAGLKTHGDTPVAQGDYEAKRDWIRSMIREVEADVIACQELWHKDCLDDVLSAPDLADYKAHYIGPEWYGIAVALIVRSPWTVDGNIETIKAFPFEELVKIDDGDGEDDELSISIKRFSRTIIKARIKHETSDRTPALTVVACHLKSKLPARVSAVDRAYRSAVGSAVSTIRRTAEATALRMLLIDHMTGEGTPTVVLGDLNDGPESNTLSLITDQPTLSKRARGADKSLYSTLYLQQLNSFRDVFYTHEYKNHKGVLDHILVSEEFFEYSTDSIWSHKETRIWNDHIEDDHPYTTDHGIIKSSFT